MKGECEPGNLVVVSGGYEAKLRSVGLNQKGAVGDRLLPRFLNRIHLVPKVTGLE